MNGLSDNEVTEAEHQERSAHHYSVDCTRANTGLFVGIIVMVFTIISLIVFFVLIKDEKLKDTAITVASLTELSLYCITSVAVLIAMCQVIFSDFFFYLFTKNFFSKFRNILVLTLRDLSSRRGIINDLKSYNSLQLIIVQ